MDRVARFEAVDERDGEVFHRDVTVDRRVDEASPVAVYYSLTQKGAELHAAFDELHEWGQKWIDEE